jgi:hypothetical protein
MRSPKPPETYGPETSKLEQHQRAELEAQLHTQPAPAGKAFENVDELLRHDAAQTAAPTPTRGTPRPIHRKHPSPSPLLVATPCWDPANGVDSMNHRVNFTRQSRSC